MQDLIDRTRTLKLVLILSPQIVATYAAHIIIKILNAGLSFSYTAVRLLLTKTTTKTEIEIKLKYK